MYEEIACGRQGKTGSRYNQDAAALKIGSRDKYHHDVEHGDGYMQRADGVENENRNREAGPE